MSNGEVGIWELISRKLAADLPTVGFYAKRKIEYKK
jgi:hypothetical protein